MIAAVLLMAIVWMAGKPAGAPTTRPGTMPAAVPLADPVAVPPDPTPEGYVYGVRGSNLLKAAIVSSLDILDDGHGGQAARITIRKGPEYAANDPDQNGYPGCTLLGALTGEFFEDKDSAQVIVCWKDRQNQTHTADNLIGGPTVGRPLAATWEWCDANIQDAVCVRLPLGNDAVELTALVIYTDVLWVYTDYDAGPEDGPAVIASWDAARTNGTWRLVARDEVGMGAVPDMDAAAREQAANLVQEMIEKRSGGRYTLQARYNIGQRDPNNPTRLIEYDSGFDIVPTQ